MSRLATSIAQKKLREAFWGGQLLRTLSCEGAVLQDPYEHNMPYGEGPSVSDKNHIEQHETRTRVAECIRRVQPAKYSSLIGSVRLCKSRFTKPSNLPEGF